MNGPDTNTTQHRKSEGQSLVETALFLPILIVMLLGIVEVSTLLVNQNRVTTAGRIAAGYGAANFNGSNWTEIADIMGIVALNSVTDTLDLAPDLWDIWSVHAVVNADGNDFETFNGVHVYGSELIVSQADWDASVKAQVRDNMLAQLQTGGGNIGGLAVVVSIPYHDSSTFLNLPIWQWMNAKTVSGLTAMRVDQPAPFAGCALLPISVALDQPSAYPSNWPTGSNPPRHASDEGGPMFYFPAPGSFDNTTQPVTWPTYRNKTGVIAPNLDTDTFVRNVPGVYFANAEPGYIYLAREEDGGTPGGFGWMSWDGAGSTPAMRASIQLEPLPPGNFMDIYPGSYADLGRNLGPDPITAQPRITGNGNGALDKFEWVEISTGNMADLRQDIIRDYVIPQRPVTLIYYDEAYFGGNLGKWLRVRGFVTVKIIGTGLQDGNDKWILFEFLRWSTECLDIGS
jgi:hypothetical protein